MCVTFSYTESRILLTLTHILRGGKRSKLTSFGLRAPYALMNIICSICIGWNQSLFCSSFQFSTFPLHIHPVCWWQKSRQTALKCSQCLAVCIFVELVHHKQWRCSEIAEKIRCFCSVLMNMDEKKLLTQAIESILSIHQGASTTHYTYKYNPS